jgi:N-acetylglutamate synthase-like GNAT family acetyltransferase
VELEIQPFEITYQEQVGKLINSIQREEFGLEITLEQQPDLLDIKGFYQHGAGNFWLALDSEKVVGTIALLDISNKRAALRKMFVAPEYRGKAGTASKLLAVLLESARNKGVKEIFLGTTAKFLAAHRFYEKHGFVEIQKEELPEKFPMMSVDTKFYKLSF